VFQAVDYTGLGAGACVGPAYNPAMATSPLYTDIAAALQRIGYGDDAAAYHGALCGALCRQEPDELDPAALLDEGSEADAVAREELYALRDQVVGALSDMHAGFALLLPDDETALAERAHALGAWCEGFLYGLAGRIKLDLHSCSEEVREIVKDFTEFTRASLDSAGDPEVEEGAYAELVEYVRVGAQLVYMELHPRPDIDGEPTPTLH
jgi:uncharacterized protein